MSLGCQCVNGEPCGYHPKAATPPRRNPFAEGAKDGAARLLLALEGIPLEDRPDAVALFVKAAIEMPWEAIRRG